MDVSDTVVTAWARLLLAQAVALDSQARQLKSELDEVI